jgi:hypothetical protein
MWPHRPAYPDEADVPRYIVRCRFAARVGTPPDVVGCQRAHIPPGVRTFGPVYPHRADVTRVGSTVTSRLGAVGASISSASSRSRLMITSVRPPRIHRPPAVGAPPERAVLHLPSLARPISGPMYPHPVDDPLRCTPAIARCPSSGPDVGASPNIRTLADVPTLPACQHWTRCPAHVGTLGLPDVPASGPVGDIGGWTRDRRMCTCRGGYSGADIGTSHDVDTLPAYPPLTPQRTLPVSLRWPRFRADVAHNMWLRC